MAEGALGTVGVGGVGQADEEIAGAGGQLEIGQEMKVGLRSIRVT